MERIPVTEYTLFYEVVDGNLMRYMEPVLVAAELRPGNGRPLVLLHSLAGGAATLEPLAAALAGLRPVVSVDLRGFGASHRPTLAYTADTWADDLAALLPALGIAPGAADVYGHGFGACAAVAALERGLVGAAVVSGVGFAAGEPSGLDDLADAGDLGESLVEALAALTGAPVIGADITSQVVSRVARGWLEYGGPADAAALAGRLLVVASANDAFTPAGAPAGAVAVGAAAGADVLTLHAGHDLPTSQPAELAAAICSFLDQKR